ncbi:unnamed protein product [Anisakis simplex]|uniref:Uncharacterized protein n=1 Tax=Anisakis simplex TaxID=6269 RepID=A0A0M3J7S3_ANISI|nr:unnamed protein product [Anisakis simplex]
MYPSSPHDKQSLIDTRLFIGKQVDKFIAESLTTQKPETTSITTHKPEIQSTTAEEHERPLIFTIKPEVPSTTTQTPRSSAPSLMSFINTFQILSFLHLISCH